MLIVLTALLSIGAWSVLRYLQRCGQRLEAIAESVARVAARLEQIDSRVSACQQATERRLTEAAELLETILAELPTEAWR